MNISRKLFGALMLLISIQAISQNKKPSQKIYDQNLIKNPDAEEPMIEQVIPYWGNADTMGVAGYGGTSGEFDEGFGTKRGLGNIYFRFSAENRNVTRRTRDQIIDLSSLTDSIKAGHVIYDLSCYSGTFNSQDYGMVTLHATFVDKSGSEISSVHTDPVSYKDIKGNDWDMIRNSISGVVPKETAKVKIFMKAVGFGDGGENNTYVAWADNLSFMIHQKKK